MWTFRFLTKKNSQSRTTSVLKLEVLPPGSRNFSFSFDLRLRILGNFEFNQWNRKVRQNDAWQCRYRLIITFYMFKPSQFEKWTFASTTASGFLIEFLICPLYYVRDCLKNFILPISLGRQVLSNTSCWQILEIHRRPTFWCKKSEKFGLVSSNNYFLVFQL